jgi:hypothetical protein
MAAAISMKDASVPRGGVDHVTATGYTAGRTIIYYVGGQFANVQASGPYGTQGYGSAGKPLNIPANAAAAAVCPVVGIDATDPTDKATTSMTVT